VKLRVVLPAHLRRIASTGEEVTVEVNGPATIETLLDALEKQYPTLKGTVRDYERLQRRPFLRFFACSEDLSLTPMDQPLPADVTEGNEPFIILGAIAGG
jgi:sulfur-carrier protein